MVRVNLFPDVKGLCKRTDSEAELCVEHSSWCVSAHTTASHGNKLRPPRLDGEEEESGGECLGDGVGVEHDRNVQSFYHRNTRYVGSLPGT